MGWLKFCFKTSRAHWNRTYYTLDDIMKQWRNSFTPGRWMLNMLMLCACAAASETANNACDAENGDACKTISSSMMQMHAVRQKTSDFVNESNEESMEKSHQTWCFQ